MTPTRADVRAALPEVAEIADDDLREGVLDAWEAALAESGVADPDDLPWLPPEEEKRLGISESGVAHVRDVTRGAVALADALADRFEVDVDLVVAGALVHDVSKCYEFDGDERTRIYDLLGHPYYGVHAVVAAGLPVELAHVVLSHSPRTSVEPATLEAAIVKAADDAAAAGIRLSA